MEQLVRRAINGDTDAFLELMDQNTQIMYKTAWSVLRNNEDASDAVAETILTCFEKIYTLKNPAVFRTWMIRILLNHCYAIIRDQAHYVRSGEIPEKTEMQNWEENEGDSFRELIQGVDEKYGMILTLYYADELTIREIAEVLRLNENTVKTRLVRGRAAGLCMQSRCFRMREWFCQCIYPAFPVLTGCCFSFKMSIVRLENHYEEPGSRRAWDF